MHFTIKYNVSLPETEQAFKIFWKKYQLKRLLIYTAAYAIAIVLGIDFIVKNPSSMVGYILTALCLGLVVSGWIKPILVRKKLIRTLDYLNEENYTAIFYDDRIEISTEIIPNDVETETIEISAKNITPSYKEAATADDTATQKDIATAEVVTDVVSAATAEDVSATAEDVSATAEDVSDRAEELSDTDEELSDTDEEVSDEPVPTTILKLATEQLASYECEESILLFVNKGLIYIFPKRCLTDDEITNLRNYFLAKNI